MPDLNLAFDLFQQVALVAISAIGVLLGWWVVGSGSPRQLKMWFVAMDFFMILWVNFAYFGLNSGSNSGAAILLRANYGAVALFLSSFFNFYTVSFLKRGKFAKILGIIILSISVFLFITSVSSELIVQNAIVREGRNEIVFGRLGFVFNIFAAQVALIVVAYSFEAYIKSGFEMRRKLKFLVAGVSIFIVANLIFNVGFQVFFQSVRYSIFGDFSAIFLLGFTAYAAIQHKLFDVKVAAAEALTAFLMALLFAKVFSSQNSAERIIDILVFLLASLFGLLLVRSVNREVAQREQLEDLTDKLKHMDDVKNEFISVAAHELRAPLTAIKGYLSMVIDGDAGSISTQTKEFLQDSLLSNERMIRLVNNMLDVGRIEEGRIIYQEGHVKISELAKLAHAEFKLEAERKDLTFELVIAKDIKDKVYVDKDRLHEVIVNFLSNALKYTEEGKVTLSLRNPDVKTVRLEVIDTGPGVSDQEKKKLFNKFYRVSSEVGKTIGSGLGLYISKLLIQKFGGSIGVESKAGEGSNFWFELPVRDDGPSDRKAVV